MAKFSVICVISKPEVFDSCLLQSINSARSDHDIEIIPIFNDGNRYSASNALNIGIDVATSNNLIFAHQDVALIGPWFDILDDFINSVSTDWGVIGSAGINLNYGINDIGKWGGSAHLHTVAVGSVWNTTQTDTIPYWDGVKSPTKVHCIDECLFVINRSTGLRFDSQFTGFHFYGVDACLQARAAGYPIYSGYLPIIHHGQYSASFKGDRKYWVYLRFLYHKWHTRFPELLGTHFHWNTIQDYDDSFKRIEKPEITSYINIELKSDNSNIAIQSMGINKVRLKTDKKRGILNI